MVDPFVVLVSVIVMAVVFDYINGFHDTANAIATVVSTNVLPPRTAILIAAVCNFGGALWTGGVAQTIGGEIADPTSVTQTVVVAALGGAVIWNLITWYYGLPSSSSHALVGGILGAVLMHRVLDQNAAFFITLRALIESKGVMLVLYALVLSPLMGLVMGFLLMIGLLWLVRRWAPATVHNLFRRLQLVSAGLMALSHGSNDAQKAMGIISMALIAYYAAPGHPPPAWMQENLLAWEHHKLIVPLWVILACASAMALGTAAGGWRIMKTMGHKIIKLKPINGFAAETAGAAVILTATYAFHAPVSTTHVISSSIMGVGASRRVSAVRWGIAGNIFVAWVLTLPVSAALAGALYYLLSAWLGP